MDEALAFFIDSLLEIGKPSPTCADETCVLEWVMLNTQKAQSIYDSASDAHLSAEDKQKVEELYQHSLQLILEQGLKSLGVLEV